MRLAIAVKVVDEVTQCLVKLQLWSLRSVMQLNDANVKAETFSEHLRQRLDLRIGQSYRFEVMEDFVTSLRAFRSWSKASAQCTISTATLM